MSILEIHAPEWMDDARCATHPPERFFPSSTVDPSYAKAICDGCPVTLACLTYATADPSIVGVWGGTTEHERKKLRGAA